MGESLVGSSDDLLGDGSALSAQTVRERFRRALEAFSDELPIWLLGHFDADGLSALAVLARALDRAKRPWRIRLVGKGENPWSSEMHRELSRETVGGLIVLDLGVRGAEILTGCPTILIDHHVPQGAPPAAEVISGNGMDPEPTSSLLAFWCAAAVVPVEDLLWLPALGLIGDMAESAGFPEMRLAQERYGKTALRNAVSLINAPRRSASADASPALDLLLKCDGPKALLSGVHPETAALLSAKAEVQSELQAAKKAAPKIRGGVALIRFSSPCQIHPLIAQQWRSRLHDKVVLAANTGYRPGWVHFAVRTASGRDLIRFLEQHRPAGAGEQYGSGHIQATGGALRYGEWNAFVRTLGFPEEQIHS